MRVEGRFHGLKEALFKERDFSWMVIVFGLVFGVAALVVGIGAPSSFWPFGTEAVREGRRMTQLILIVLGVGALVRAGLRFAAVRRRESDRGEE